jgi:glycosyltransferase involved in cell wall biosynthesis
MMVKVSVIIPAYNASAHVGRALDSVLGQDYENLEIIIVNDGSTDDLKSAIRGYLGDKRIKYIETENRGVSHAINTGLKEAGGDYVCFLHADDKFLPGKIKKQLSLMERFPGFGVSYTDENYFLEGTSRRVKEGYFHFSGDIFYFLKRSNFIHMSTAMLKKKILGGETLDESLRCHEEWDLFLRLSAKGVRFLNLREELSDISFHSKNLSFDRGTMDATRAVVGKRARNLWYDFKKNINFHSAPGILNLKRYLTFKLYAAIIGFPKHKKFNPKSPREVIGE